MTVLGSRGKARLPQVTMGFLRVGDGEGASPEDHDARNNGYPSGALKPFPVSRALPKIDPRRVPAHLMLVPKNVDHLAGLIYD